MQRERAGGKVEHIAADNVGRHEIRSALDAAKFQMEEPSKTLDDERLRNTRYTFQQGMAPAQQGEQALVDQFCLANDNFGQLLASMRQHLGHYRHEKRSPIIV